MLIINLMMITFLILSVILLSGVKIMLNSKYAQIITFLIIIYTPFSELIEGYKLGYTGIISIIIFVIVFSLIFIWAYRRNKHIYSIHNVKQKDVINIIERYLEMKNIKYEIRGNEIQLPELYKVIYVKGLIGIRLDCRDIKDTDLYNDILMEVGAGIKDIKKKYLPIEGMIYFRRYDLFDFCWNFVLVKN